MTKSLVLEHETSVLRRDGCLMWKSNFPPSKFMGLNFFIFIFFASNADICIFLKSTVCFREAFSR